MESSRIEQIGKLLSPGMDIRTTSIPAGDIDDTIDDTMDVIIQEILIGMRLPEIRRVVANILKEKTGTEWTIPERAWRGEIKAIHAHVHGLYADLYNYACGQ